MDSAFDFASPGGMRMSDFQEVGLTGAKESQSIKELELEIVNIFREQMDMERMIERIKTDLSLRTDFNLIDGFRFFDSDGKSWVAASELKEGLQFLEVFANDDDLALFMKRYDKDGDGRLKYTEFCDSFLPLD